MHKYSAILTALSLMSYWLAPVATAQVRPSRTPVLEPTRPIQIDSNPSRPQLGGLAAPGVDEPGNASVQHYPCGDITSCNVLIAKCAEWGGDWVETGTPGPQGQPQKGICTVR